MTKINEGPLFHKPKSFFAAKNVLYASITTGILAVLMHYLFSGASNNNPAISYTIIVAEYIILIIIIKQMALCRKWARTVVPVLCILIILTYVFLFIMKSATGLLEASLFAIQVLLQIMAVVFLYKEECNIWFNSRKGDMLP